VKKFAWSIQETLISNANSAITRPVKRHPFDFLQGQWQFRDLEVRLDVLITVLLMDHASEGSSPMTQQVRSPSPLFTQVDISQNVASTPAPNLGTGVEQSNLLRDILQAMDRQNELMEELISQVNNVQRQRMQELAQWKEANPRLSRNCRTASEALAKVQTEFLSSLANEVNENPEGLLEGEYMLNEFIDRYGPRLAHLNGVLQVLTQLGSPPPAPSAQ
jgi:hypothetical protein